LSGLGAKSDIKQKSVESSNILRNPKGPRVEKEAEKPDISVKK